LREKLPQTVVISLSNANGNLFCFMGCGILKPSFFVLGAMKDLSSLYLKEGLAAVAAEDLSAYSLNECTDVFEWAAEWNHPQLLLHLFPYANPSRLNGFALRHCIRHGFVEGVELLLPYNDLRDASTQRRFNAFTEALSQNNASLLEVLLRPVCKCCHSFDCDHPKEIVSGDLAYHNHFVVYTAAHHSKHLFKSLLGACNIEEVRLQWSEEWTRKTLLSVLFDQTVEQLAHEQAQRIHQEIAHSGLGPSKRKI